ncbi:MAG TPA: SxtJ family membrane protein [Thermoguttaceae bacterium]|nr:SxtJ family membrane protein [Thermoguttaceae bacterium]
MSIIRINRDPTRLQLFVFGLAWLLFFGVVGALVWGRGGASLVALGMGAAAVIVPLVGMVCPRFLRMVYLGMAYAAFPIGFVVSHLLLAVVYYLVLTPTGLLMRAFGHDPMGRRFDPGASSYWVPRKGPPSADRYFRQS